jgi:very-short-patch-repair endonuclease
MSKGALAQATFHLTLKTHAKSWAAKEISKYCESPIELILGMELWMAVLGFSNYDYLPCCCSQKEFYEGNNLDEDCLTLIPQYEWQNYRIDFAICFPVAGCFYLIFVECDGKEFHDTPEQKWRDQQKNIAAEQAGIPLFRFSGSQIHRDAEGCADEVMAVIEQIIAEVGTIKG